MRMNQIRSIFQALTRNSEMKTPKEGTKGSIYLSLGIIALSCIMLPCCFVVGYVSYFMTMAMIAADNRMGGIVTEVQIISAFSMVFGMMVIFSVLFFSSDREHLVTLPIASHHLMMAKFLYAYMAESIMEFMVLIAMFIGYFIALGKSFGAAAALHPVGLITALLGVALIPLVPLAYCGIISLILMAVLKNVRKRKVFDRVSSVLMLLFIALFLLSFAGLDGITVENYMNSLANESNLFFRVMNIFFFPVAFMRRALAENNVLYILLYLLANALVVAVFYLVGYFTYQEGLYMAAGLGSGKRSADRKGNAYRQKSFFAACVAKEWKVLTRTKAFAGNCVYINILWPFGVWLFFHLMGKKEGMIRYVELYREGAPRAMLIFLLAVITVSFLAAALNSLASASFSREGAHVSLIKYVPVPYRIQAGAKAFISLALTWTALLLSLCVAWYFMRFNAVMFIYFAVIAFCANIISIAFGMGMDSASPYTYWDDEYSALRGNLNSFFNMAIIMVISLLLAILGLLLDYAGVGITAIEVGMLLLMIAAAAVAFWKGSRIILNNIEEIY